MTDSQQNVTGSSSCRIFMVSTGYLSSPHAGQEPPFARDAQQGAVISSPVVPAAASGEQGKKKSLEAG